MGMFNECFGVVLYHTAMFNYLDDLEDDHNNLADFSIRMQNT